VIFQRGNIGMHGTSRMAIWKLRTRIRVGSRKYATT
jgi:hypothetical protein